MALPSDWPEYLRPKTERDLGQLMHDARIAFELLDHLGRLPYSEEREHHLEHVGEVFRGLWGELEVRHARTRAVSEYLHQQRCA